MKKTISLLLAIIMLLGITAGLSLSAYADDEYYVSGDFEYRLLDDGTAEVTDYSGTAIDLTIPSELDGYAVTSINNLVFDNCMSLVKITVPEGITSIGSEAFMDCVNLTYIVLPESINYIGGSAFSGTAFYNDSNNWENDVLYYGKYLICARETISGSYLIKNGTEIIADAAFLDCINLSSVTIPNGITSVVSYMFARCTNLESVTIPNSVTKIEGQAFDACESLTNIEIPDGVTDIEYGAFMACRSLTDVKIPNSVKNIGVAAFEGCSSLTSITIPESVSHLYDFTFYGCEDLTEIYIMNKNCEIIGSEIGPAETIFPENATIYGYKGSTAQEYAEKYDRNFVAIDKDEPTIDAPKDEPTVDESTTDAVKGNSTNTETTKPSTVDEGASQKSPSTGTASKGLLVLSAIALASGAIMIVKKKEQN